jgi:hypothetical protein
MVQSLREMFPLFVFNFCTFAPHLILCRGCFSDFSRFSCSQASPTIINSTSIAGIPHMGSSFQAAPVQYIQPAVSYAQPGLAYPQPTLAYAQQPVFAQPALYAQQGFSFAQPQPLQYAQVQYAQPILQSSAPAVVPASPPSPVASRNENIFARQQPQ